MVKIKKLPPQKPKVMQMEWGVQIGPNTKNRVSPETNLVFRKFCFSIRISYKELIWCFNYQIFQLSTVHIHTFRKRLSFIRRLKIRHREKKNWIAPESGIQMGSNQIETEQSNMVPWYK